MMKTQTVKKNKGHHEATVRIWKNLLKKKKLDFPEQRLTSWNKKCPNYYLIPIVPYLKDWMFCLDEEMGQRPPCSSISLSTQFLPNSYLFSYILSEEQLLEYLCKWSLMSNCILCDKRQDKKNLSDCLHF